MPAGASSTNARTTRQSGRRIASASRSAMSGVTTGLTAFSARAPTSESSCQSARRTGTSSVTAMRVTTGVRGTRAPSRPDRGWEWSRRYRSSTLLPPPAPRHRGVRADRATPVAALLDRSLVFRGSGTALNVATVLVGSGLGIALRGRLPERTRDVVTDGLGLVTLLVAALSAVSVRDGALR